MFSNSEAVNSESDNFLRVVTYPRNKRETFLAQTIQLHGEGAAERIASDLASVTKQDISNYAVANFNALDRYPNPRDQMISDSELVEALQNSTHRKEQAILVAMWLRFEEIKNAHVDATGMDVVYDTQISYWDCVKYGEDQASDVQQARTRYAEPNYAEAQYTGAQFAGQNYTNAQYAESSYSEAQYADVHESELQYAESQMNQIFSQQQPTRESVSSQVTLHTIYGDNIIGNYFE